MKFKKSLVAAAAVGTLTLAGIAHAQSPTFFRIGTGGAGGTYFPIGGTIANAISAPPGSRPCEDGGQCGVPDLIAIAQSTTASVFNNAAVQNGELEAGLAAADVTRSMFLGEGKFEGNAHPKLRSCPQEQQSIALQILKVSVLVLHKLVLERKWLFCRCSKAGELTETISKKQN